MKTFITFTLLAVCAIAHYPPPPLPPPHFFGGVMGGPFDRKWPDFHDYTFTTYVPAEHHFTQIYNHSVRQRSVCIESGFFGTIEGYREHVHQAIHPCLYGQIKASEDGKSLVIDSPRGASGPTTYAAITTLGPVTLLQHTLEIKLEVDTYTPYESISICADGRLCAIGGLDNNTVVVEPVKEVYSEPLTMCTEQGLSFKPIIGDVYIIRVTNASTITDDLRTHTTAIIKLVVSAIDDGRISFEWATLYGDSRFKRHYDFHFDSDSDEHHKDDFNIRGERSSTRGAAITALIFSLFCIIAIVVLFLIQFKDRLPFANGFAYIN